jgi:biopolymer transport protein TolQ
VSYMEQTIVDSVQLGGSTELDLSIIGLFLSADPVVKTVMIGLIIVSVCTWAIIFDKVFKLRGLRSRARVFEDSFWHGDSLQELYGRIGTTASDPMSLVFSNAMKEWEDSAARTLGSKREEARASLRGRLQQIMNLTIDREIEQLERNMSFLASVGSTAPFVGLFGTVWGIMDAFQAIAATKTTALSVVAPGIAEALFATALGLVAAIPAVIAYNKISHDLDRFAQRLEGFSAEFLSILSRQLDEGA